MAILRVLVIEDDGGITAALELVLAVDGHEVLVAPDGITGLKRLRTPPPPDIVLVDLALPGMGGRELVELVAGDSGMDRVPIIVMTAASGADLLPKSGTYRALLRKPFEIEEVLRLVAQLQPGAGGVAEN